MQTDWGRLSTTFVRFFDSEKASGVLLIGCTVISLVLANSSFSTSYLHLWERQVGGLRVEEWINDGLMALFFLLIGLELERELYSGELSHPRRALLPALAALGGMVVPASIHYLLNANTPTQVGVGIPMATDIAFALAVLAVLGSRVPTALKVFVVAFAVMDDLGAIVVIAAFYATDVAAAYLAGAVVVWVLLLVLNRRYRVMSLLPYAVGGVLMWWLVLRSGVHATLAGVALAFAIPYSAKDSDRASPSHKLELWLQKPVAYAILPVFALANTGVAIGPGWMHNLSGSNSLGIILGLTLGKPIGVTVSAYAAIASGLCRLPTDVNWLHVVGAGLLGGIGFTMSLFITNLAFVGDGDTANASRLAILVSSVTAGVVGYVWLRLCSRPNDMAVAVSTETTSSAEEPC
jgi:NhaA family Na+:H+ antiporter